MLLTSTTQPIYDAALEAKGPPAAAEFSDDDVGQITSRIGKSFVHEDTSMAVEMALGEAYPGRGVSLISKCGCAIVEAGDNGSAETCLEWPLCTFCIVAVACEDVLEWLALCSGWPGVLRIYLASRRMVRC